MFDIEICEPRHVILIRFRGELAEADFTALDALGRESKASEPFDCVFDMTRVEKADLATGFVSQRGELPQAFKDRERIYVVSEPDLKLLVRLYAAYQASKGWRAPVIVETLDEALQRLGLAAADFRPVGRPGMV
jgi:hypothetical protein